jgi:hypothetical protein
MIKKSYKLIEFGNKAHSPLLLAIMGVLSAAAVGVVTGSSSNATLTYRQIVQQKNLKSGLRRVAWYIRRSRIGISLIDDVNFDITEDLSVDEIRPLQSYLHKRERSLSAEEYHADWLYLYAYHIHYHARLGEIDYNAISAFKESASLLLQYCNRQPLRQDETRNKAKKSEIDPRFVSDATRILQTFASHLPPEQFGWYIISGTFLGLHREGGFLPHDIDLDFGIHAEETELEVLIHALGQIPDMTIKNITNIPTLQVQNDTVSYRERPGIIKLLHDSGIQIDLFVHHMENGKRIHGSKIHLWENTPFGLTTRTLAGIEVLCPDNPDQYLTENYGDWRTPVTEFSCSTGTPNMTLSPNMFSVAFFLRKLYTHIIRGEHQSYQKTYITLQQQGIISENQILLPFIKN